MGDLIAYFKFHKMVLEISMNIQTDCILNLLIHDTCSLLFHPLNKAVKRLYCHIHVSLVDCFKR